jgi:hypothetical protein
VRGPQSADLACPPGFHRHGEAPVRS